MGLRFNKTIHLGKGLELQLGKNGPIIKGGVGKIRINANKRGIKATAYLGKTGLSFSKNLPLPVKKKENEEERIEIVSKNTVHPFFKRDIPSELKSKVYPLQSILGIIGILFVFLSFIDLLLLFIGGLIIFIHHIWRKKTSPALVAYKNAYKEFNSKKYQEAIESLNIVLKHPKADPALELVKAECLLELDKPSQAYELYAKFFNEIDPVSLDSITYWSPKANAILLSIQNNNYDLALLIAESFPNSGENTDFRLWKNYFKGLCFLGLQQYEAAVQAFQTAVGKRRNMDEPFIDCHYFMGVAYTYLGKSTLANKRFQRVYSANTQYKNIGEIMNRISEGESIIDIIMTKN
ncbi:tetratricopeptide repeat protein [Alkaliphilus pronyensis]|nr:tetratricopeptide repeat protein [Alkaliphilus pronyensis]